MKKIKESVYSDNNLVIPLADVQHIEKRKLDQQNNAETPFLMVIMKSTVYNTKIDDWENPVYIPSDSAQSFLYAWQLYRHEIDNIEEYGKVKTD